MCLQCGLSQSPFGFWGDWNVFFKVKNNKRNDGHNRLSAFGVIGTWIMLMILMGIIMSQSPFGFWGDWNQTNKHRSKLKWKMSQSPFGFWGDWNVSPLSGLYTYVFSHNRLSAFGVIGTCIRSDKGQIVSVSQSPFGFWGDWNKINTLTYYLSL